MRAARVDSNQGKIDEAAEKVGCCIVRASKAPELGFDRLYIRHGRVYIVEVKDGEKPPSKRQLTDNEKRTRADIEAAGGVYHVIESVDDFYRMVGMQ